MHNNQLVIFIPLLAQVFLTACVWVWMYTTRITEMRRKRIAPQKGATAVDASMLLKSVAGPSDNFTNLLEAPVLFYVAVIALYVTNLVDTTYVALAIAYVALRTIHSLIHITYNKVIHRFAIYAVSMVILWSMWVRIGLDLLGKTL